jgi:O-antigen ligase
VLALAGSALVGWAVFLRGEAVFLGFVAAAGFALVITYPHFGLYAMLFLVPLQNVVVIGEGTTLVRVVGLTAGVVWGAAKVVKREPLRPLLTSPLTTPLLVFLGLAAISVSWSDFYTWRRDFTSYVQLVVMVFIVLDVIDSPRRLKEVLAVLFLGSLISAGIVLYNSLSVINPSYLWDRPEGGHGDPNFTASTFLTLMPIAFWLVLDGKGWRRLLGVVSAAFFLTAVGLTVSRTGLTAILLLVISYLALISEGRVKYLFLILVILLIVSPFLPWEKIQYRFEAPDLLERVVRFRHAWHVLRNYPLTGGGLGREGRRTVIYVIHNLFLEIAAQLGLPGLLSMAWLWGTAWICLSRAYKEALLQQNGNLPSLINAIRVGLIVYLYFSLTLSTHKTRLMWLVLALGTVSYQVVRGTSADKVTEIHSYEKG